MSTPNAQGSQPPQKTPRRRRKLAIAVVVVAIALVVAGVRHLLCERPVPRVAELLPEDGSMVCFDLPRGELDAQLARLIFSAIRYYTTDGSWLGVTPEFRKLAGSTPLLLRTRPWRIGYWESGNGEWLFVVCASGMGKVLEYFAGTNGVVEADVESRGVSLAMTGGILVLGARREDVAAAVARLTAAGREYILSEATCSFQARHRRDRVAADRKESRGGLRLFDGVFPGAGRDEVLAGSLRSVGGDSWSLELEMSEDTRDALPDVRVRDEWGEPGLRDFLVREGLGVSLSKPVTAPLESSASVTWRLDGIAAFLEEASDGLEFWSRSSE